MYTFVKNLYIVYNFTYHLHKFYCICVQKTVSLHSN